MSIKILLADDSITIQKVIGIIFGGEEYSLTVVDNGKAAVEKARETSPDILLIDALMPGMSGYEVCEQIRAIPELASKPILLLTGSFEPFDEDKARQSGADAFISKPFESQQIVTKVKELHEMGATRTAPPVQPAAAAVVEPAPAPAEPAAAPIVEEPAAAPPIADVFETSATPDDIWGAFTSPAEPEPAPAAAPAAPAAPPEPLDQPGFDVFAIVNEESDAQVMPAQAGPAIHETTGSQWIPVEEQTFEFGEEEVIAYVPPAVLSGSRQQAEETAFGEISFADVDEEVAEPAAAPVEEPPQEIFSESAESFEESDVTPFAEPAPSPFGAAPEAAPAAASFAEVSFAEITEPVVEPEPAPLAPQPPPAPATAPSSLAGSAALAPAVAALTEEQLKTALASVSQEVIERIVWEVVPDLAETLIREAIRKIKEGV